MPEPTAVVPPEETLSDEFLNIADVRLLELAFVFRKLFNVVEGSPVVRNFLDLVI